MPKQVRPHTPAPHGPAVFVTTTALQQIRDEMLAFPHSETAWVNYGMIQRACPVPIITLLGILTQKETSHAFAHTVIGGENLAPKMDWLKNAFEVLRNAGKYPPDSEFLFLFKGHSHHQLHLLNQSWQDRHSTLQAVREDGVEFALAPITILTTNSKLIYIRHSIYDGERQSDISIWEEGNVTVTIRFHYYSSALAEAGVRSPLVIRPAITAEYAEPLPLLWIYSHEEDFAHQMKHLEEQGYRVHPWKQEYPNGLRLYVSRPGWKSIVAINTPWDYPEEDATFQITPKDEHQDAPPPTPEAFTETFAALLCKLDKKGE
jgi:hypothetical protein